MSIHDEQEIERLRASADELRLAVTVSEIQLREAMGLLKDACCVKGDMLNSQIWQNRLKKLQDRYNGKDQ